MYLQNNIIFKRPGTDGQSTLLTELNKDSVNRKPDVVLAATDLKGIGHV